jgi:uncharacterized membrane protein
MNTLAYYMFIYRKGIRLFLSSGWVGAIGLEVLCIFMLMGIGCATEGIDQIQLNLLTFLSVFDILYIGFYIVVLLWPSFYRYCKKNYCTLMCVYWALNFCLSGCGILVGFSSRTKLRIYFLGLYVYTALCLGFQALVFLVHMFGKYVGHIMLDDESFLITQHRQYIAGLPIKSPLLAAGPGRGACSICLEQITPGQLFPIFTCGHRNHYTCMVPWLKDHSTCPICRQVVFKV